MRRLMMISAACLLVASLTACDSGGGGEPPPKGGARRPVEPGARKAPGFDPSGMKKGEEGQESPIEKPEGGESKPPGEGK
jgi:hypothetical protein